MISDAPLVRTLSEDDAMLGIEDREARVLNEAIHEGLVLPRDLTAMYRRSVKTAEAQLARELEDEELDDNLRSLPGVQAYHDG